LPLKDLAVAVGWPVEGFAEGGLRKFRADLLNGLLYFDDALFHRRAPARDTPGQRSPYPDGVGERQKGTRRGRSGYVRCMERKSTQPGEMPPPGMDAERAVRQERRRAYERAAKARRAQRWAKLKAEACRNCRPPAR